jgi:hypothetical protein
MLYERKQIPELEFIKHRHDDKDTYIDYEKFILKKSLSPYIFNNSVMDMFLNRMEPLVSIFSDKMNVIKNFKNYMVDKYYYKQKG